MRLIGFPLQLSFKLYVAILNAATFWIASFCFRRIFKEDRIAVFGGILYTLAPYRLSNLYIRGAILNQLLVMFPNGVEENYSIVEGLTEGREISFAIGIAFVLGAVLFLINWKRYQEGGKAELKLGTYCFWAGLLLAFMSTVWFPWDFLYESSDILKILISHLQFPRRVLGTTRDLVSVVTCLVLKEYGKQENGKYFEVLLTVMLVFTGITTLYSFDSMAEESDYIYVADMESLNSFDVGRGEYMPAGTAAAWESMPEGRILKNEAVKITDYRKQGTKISFVCTNTSSEEQAVELPLLYYRGYEAWDSDTKGIIAIDGEGDNGKRVRLAETIPEPFR